jgi:hypothetical protein
MKKKLNPSQPRKLALAIKILTFILFFLYYRHVKLLIELSDRNIEVEYLSGFLEYYSFLLIGLLNLVLLAIYSFKTTKNKLRYDRTIIGLIILLIILIVVYFMILLPTY